MRTRTLTSPQVERLVDWDELLDALERAHRALATGAAQQPVPIALRDPADEAFDAPTLVPMASFAPDLGLFAIKVLADAPRNRGRDLPAQRSTIALYASDSGACVGVVDGRSLTRIRTAAATALATRALARPESSVLALLGSGALALEHAAALSRLIDFDEVRLWSRSFDRARTGADQLRARGIPAVPADAVATAVRDADIVCTLTPAVEPVLSAGMLGAGVHVNAVGSPPRPGYTELAPSVFARADLVVVDSRPIAQADSGNIRNALAAGALDPGRLVEIGEILEGLVPGRRTSADITVYNSVGIGLQDLAAADHVLRRAASEGVGCVTSIRD